MNNFSIEFYRENGKYCAYIGDDCSSGYKIIANSREALIDHVADYFNNLFDEGFIDEDMEGVCAF